MKYRPITTKPPLTQGPGSRSCQSAISGENGPQDHGGDIDCSEPCHPHRMEELEWCEGQRCEEDDRHPSQQRCGLEQEKVKCGRVPKRWKTAEVVVCGLHVSVGEIERATDDNDDPGGQRKRLRQQAPGNDRIGRNEYVGDEINDQVEHVARPARERFCDLEPTRDRSVDPVDDKCDAEAHEHGRPLAPHRVDQGGERERRAAGSEDVHRERAGWGKRRQGIPRSACGTGRQPV